MKSWNCKDLGLALVRSGALMLTFGAIVLQIEQTAFGQTDQQIAWVQQEHLKHWGYSTVSWSPSWKAVSVEQAAELEQQLIRDPEDAKTRIRLLTYYFHNDLRQQRVDSVCWLIEHHPESPVLGLIRPGFLRIATSLVNTTNRR